MPALRRGHIADLIYQVVGGYIKDASGSRLYPALRAQRQPEAKIEIVHIVPVACRHEDRFTVFQDRLISLHIPQRGKPVIVRRFGRYELLTVNG